MFNYVIFKVDNKYYLYSVQNNIIIDWGYNFNKLFKEYIEFVQYQINNYGINIKLFSLYIKKFQEIPHYEYLRKKSHTKF